MEKISGLILDVYDDKDGLILRELFSSQDDLPDIIKTAEQLNLDALPDDLFALVLKDGDVTLRKFACADAGNTHMSIQYFLKTAHKLPEEAQRVAAENLVVASSWYDLTPPEDLLKIAGLGMTAFNAAVVLPSTVREGKTALTAAKAAGPNIVTPTQLRTMMAG